MKKSISVSIDSDKLSALNMYLAQRNLNLTDEIEKQIEVLYAKTVPQNVRDFIGMKSLAKPEKKPKKPVRNVPEGQPEQ